MLTRKQYLLLLFIDERLRTTGISPSFDEMKDALNLKSKSGIHRLIKGLEERGFLRRLPHRARALEILRLPDNLAPDQASGLPTDDGPTAEGAPEAPPESGPGAGAASRPDPAGAGGPGRFSPQVIRGDFTPSLPAARVDAATTAPAVTLPLLGKIAAGTPITALADPSTHIEVPATMLARGDHFVLTVEGDSMIEAGILDGDLAVVRRCDSADTGSIVVALVDQEEATLKRLRRKGASIALEPANAAYKTQIYGPDRVQIQGVLVGLMRTYPGTP